MVGWPWNAAGRRELQATNIPGSPGKVSPAAEQEEGSLRRLPSGVPAGKRPDGKNGRLGLNLVPFDTELLFVFIPHGPTKHLIMIWLSRPAWLQEEMRAGCSHTRIPGHAIE